MRVFLLHFRRQIIRIDYSEEKKPNVKNGNCVAQIQVLCTTEQLNLRCISIT